MMIVSEAWRMLRRNFLVKLNGLEKFTGTDDEICNNIIRSCYNPKKKYFQVSPGTDSNYAEFYARDFGWCCESLINLGYKKEVLETLSYAMNIYSKNKNMTVAINPSGIPFNFPNIYSPDSIAYMFRSLRIAKAKDIIITHKDFLNSEILRFEENVLDKTKGIVKEETFSGMRDYAIVKASCYDMIMTCMLDSEIDNINKLFEKKILDNKLSKYALKNNLMKYYWNKKYFKNGINDKTLAAHNNIYPYWLDIISDKKKKISSIHSIRDSGLDKPLPTKYSIAKPKTILHALFVPGWEHDAAWTMLGMAYIDVLSKIDKRKAGEHLKQYKILIEKNSFVEVYDGLKPYSSLFYSSETRMLWAAMYLDLKKNL